MKMRGGSLYAPLKLAGKSDGEAKRYFCTRAVNYLRQVLTKAYVADFLRLYVINSIYSNVMPSNRPIANSYAAIVEHLWGYHENGNEAR